MKPPSAKSCPACGERYEGDVLFCPKDGTPLSNTRSASFQTADTDAYVGLELAGQIRIKHLIGIGSMGRVYRAFQAGIERDVAVKVLHRELSGNAELVARFHREAKVASRLVHPNVVQVLMTGTVPFRADPKIGGEMYLVMEHLDGISLLSALAAAGNTGTAALPLPRALHIILQLCDAVGEAHVQGIVHRDLKPENVMLIRRGEDPDYVKVLDFGIARIDWANQSMATQAGLIFGTAKYISPEGAAGEGVGPPADVYSIATILYQCLAGRAPFEDESPVALLVQHTHAVPPELRSIQRASYVPAPIAEVVMQNLAKKPSARAQDARAFGRDLVAAMRASGLDPEEIIAHSTLLVRGAVRLASHARTKSMDMTPELASVIAQASKARPLPAPPVPAVAPNGQAAGPPAPTINDVTVEDLAKEEAAKDAAKAASAGSPGEGAQAQSEGPQATASPAGQGAAPSSGVSAILVGVRPTDTMVVHASELFDVMPPPLPEPPPAKDAESVAETAETKAIEGSGEAVATSESADAIAATTKEEAAESVAVAEKSEGEIAVSTAGSQATEEVTRVAPPPLPEEDVTRSAPASMAAAAKAELEAKGDAIDPSAKAGSEKITATPAPVSGSEKITATPAPIAGASKIGPTPAPVIAEAEASARTAEASNEGEKSAPGEEAERSRTSGEAVPVMPLPAGMTPPPPSLRTLFDAPAPEAVSARPSIVGDAGPAASGSGDLAPVAPERPGGTQVGPSPFEGDSIDQAIPPSAEPSVSQRASIPSHSEAVAAGVGPVVKGVPHTPELDWNDAPKPHFQSTMQGTSVESSPEPSRSRSRVPRILGIFAIAAAVAASAVMFSRYFQGSHSAESNEPFEDMVEQARECVRTRSWDSPPGANVKDITARALEQSPNDARILEIRREAAVKIVNEALGRKYSGDRDGATRLAKLAAELNPEDTTARGLLDELQPNGGDDAPVASGTASADVKAIPTASAKASGQKGAKNTLPSSSTATPAKGTPSTVVPAKSGKPNVPPKGTGGPAVLPQPTSSGPWL